MSTRLVNCRRPYDCCTANPAVQKIAIIPQRKSVLCFRGLQGMYTWPISANFLTFL